METGMKIKICGLTRECDIDYVNEAMPDYIGFVFAKSRRQVQPGEAANLRRRLAGGIQTVGVFVDGEMEQVLALVKEGILDMIQLHGQEPPDYVREMKENLQKMSDEGKKCKIMKALHPERTDRKDRVYEEYIAAGVDYFLFDSGSRPGSGGTGQAFCWSLIPKLSHPYFLAGGICAENVEEAMRLADPMPYGLDISSGVETDGVKDKEKILEIVRRIRNV